MDPIWYPSLADVHLMFKCARKNKNFSGERERGRKIKREREKDKEREGERLRERGRKIKRERSWLNRKRNIKRDSRIRK